jgi:hypothetical protein
MDMELHFREACEYFSVACGKVVVLTAQPHNRYIKVCGVAMIQCGASFYRASQAKHDETCPLLPVACPQGCNIARLTRTTMEKHNRVCPLAIIPCERQCGESFFRQYQRRHNKRCHTTHLSRGPMKQHVQKHCPSSARVHTMDLAAHMESSVARHASLCPQVIDQSAIDPASIVMRSPAPPATLKHQLHTPESIVAYPQQPRVPLQSDVMKPAAMVSCPFRPCSKLLRREDLAAHMESSAVLHASLCRNVLDRLTRPST